MLNKNKILILLVTLLTSLTLSSCNFKLLNVSTFSEDRMYSSFIAFNGKEDTELYLEEGSKVTIYTTIQVAKGEVSFNVYDPIHDLIVTTTSEEDEIVFTADSTGIYTFEFEGDWATGDYNAFWLVEEKE